MSSRKKTRTPPASAAPSAPGAEPEEIAPDSGAKSPAVENSLAAIARAQEGQYSAEAFWKTAGRFTKLR